MDGGGDDTLTVGVGMNGYYDRDYTNVLIGGRAMMCYKAFSTKTSTTLTRGWPDRIIDYDHTHRYEDTIVFRAGIAGRISGDAPRDDVVISALKNADGT